MRPDPKPYYSSPLLYAYCPVRKAYSYRVNGLRFMNLFKLQAGMFWIFFPQCICFSGRFFNVVWQITECFPETDRSNWSHLRLSAFVLPFLYSSTASDASIDSPLCEESKDFCHSSSSLSKDAMAFCCAAGILLNLENTFFKAIVILTKIQKNRNNIKKRLRSRFIYYPSHQWSVRA